MYANYDDCGTYLIVVPGVDGGNDEEVRIKIQKLISGEDKNDKSKKQST